MIAGQQLVRALTPVFAAQPWLPRSVTTQIDRFAPILLAAATWLSLNPYFVWGSINGLLFGGIAAALVAAASWAAGNRPHMRKLEFLGLTFLSLFLVYVTIEPKVNSGHTRWVFILPTLYALGLLTASQRRRCLMAFATIFAITVIPGILISIWVALGLPMTFGERPHSNPTMAASGVKMLTTPVALFIESNSIALPWGGVLFRLCGIYDEPGTVGTMSALLLAALAFRFRDWRVTALSVAGVLSFSLAFFVLGLLGLVGHSIFSRRPLALLAVAPFLLAGAILLTFRPGAVSNLSVLVTPETAGAPTRTVAPGPALRQNELGDNRALPTTQALFNEYLHSDTRTLLLGIASDASVVRSGLSFSWTRVPIDHGILGSVLLFGGAAMVGFSAWRRSLTGLAGLLFLAIFALSVYQRPVIWMPYALLVLMCGPFIVPRQMASRNTPRDRPETSDPMMPSA